MPESSNIFTVGGTVQASGGIYLPRPADDELLQHCLAGDFCYVLTARQMGKSSLMVHTVERLRAHNHRAATIDLTALGTSVQAEQWYLGLIDKLVEELHLEINYRDWWQARDHLGATQRLMRFLRDEILTAFDEPLVIFIDEIDTTLSLPFSDDFFAAVRACYNARSTDAAYKRLSFVLLGVATPSDLIRDPKRTPFNIGNRIDLTDFTLEQALPLAQGFVAESTASQAAATELLKHILAWSGGHPYLTQRLCRAVLDANRHAAETGTARNWDEAAVAQVVAATFFGEKSKQDGNLQFVRDMLTQRAPTGYKLTILQYLRALQRGQKVKDEEQSIPKMHLKLSGIVRREGDFLVLRNRVYANVFDQRWLRQSAPVSRTTLGLYAAALLLMVLVGFALSNGYAAQVTEPRALAQVSLSILAQEPPVELREAEKAAADLATIQRTADEQNLLFQVLWGGKLKDLAQYADADAPLRDYYQRRWNWLQTDFNLPDPTRLRLLSLHEMATMDNGAFSKQTLRFLAYMSAKQRKSVWELADITAQTQQIESIFAVLYPEAEYTKEMGVLAFLAEGALRINRPDLAEQALAALRVMLPHKDFGQMASIPAGTFEMGSDIGDSDESPVHTVSLDAFEMDVYEVTNAEYAVCVAAGVCAVPAFSESFTRATYYGDAAFGNYPVIGVDWFDANTYCTWRGGRLPTEAEWEYAARGGLAGKLYPWGDEPPDCSRINFPGCVGDTAPVGIYAANGYGLYDMVGNVWEWTADWYSAEYYQTSPSSNPLGPNSGEVRVVRGGSWFGYPDVMRVALRDGYTPVSTVNVLGFRCVRGTSP